jgi:HPt (histidine-containing phosphotransfer) domain-containing protein
MDSALLNASEIHQLADDMGDMAQEIIFDLINALEHDVHRSLGEMRDAIGQGNPEKLRQAAHRLKSGCAQIGAVVAASLCQDLESGSFSGGISEVSPLIDQLEQVCAESIVALRNITF